MNFTLKRVKYSLYGILGELRDDAGNIFAVTLEHAYSEDGMIVPKVSVGVYTCKRHAPNRLPYETFELQDVPNFVGLPVSGILIHRGNYNKDSDGCILIGSEFNALGIGDSQVAFDKFMELQQGVQEFTLTILS